MAICQTSLYHKPGCGRNKKAQNRKIKLEEKLFAKVIGQTRIAPQNGRMSAGDSPRRGGYILLHGACFGASDAAKGWKTQQIQAFQMLQKRLHERNSCNLLLFPLILSGLAARRTPQRITQAELYALRANLSTEVVEKKRNLTYTAAEDSVRRGL